MRSASRAPRGFSLVEIMVALLIGMLLVAAILQLFIANKQTFRATEALSRLQENARFALEVMTGDIHKTGYTGCPSSSALTNLLQNNASVWWEDFGDGTIRGYDGNTAFPGQAFGTSVGARVAGTDAVILLQAGGDEYSVVSHAAGSAQMTLDRAPAFEAGSVILVCDAKRTSILQLTAVSGSTITFASSGSTPGNSGGLTHDYGQDAKVVGYQPTAYYVGVAASGASPRSLYRYRLDVAGASANPVAEELIDEVNDLQLHYGIDANGDNLVDLAYLDATGVTDWTEVVSIRLSLLFRSAEENVTTRSQRVIFPTRDTGLANDSGSWLTAASSDRGRYWPAFSTATIRNRLP
ncbi:hypothetical protein G3480_14050 [Thiorhodococcus mannitoliphagus]|uniref:Prepilin-type N-terminal cleavage/methylation domain-containing protein n=1 Tax=Thiorhodococcus mannitoliphagus TaxID=329406 RepID=A0A6P1DW91_9GAMM|nr:PilW family protein [Thiorhodococcus mannitoliphagus]NEX21423.1 hypothetical protein [Thiorhodococcus mannitoliphagus]